MTSQKYGFGAKKGSLAQDAYLLHIILCEEVKLETWLELNKQITFEAGWATNFKNSATTKYNATNQRATKYSKYNKGTLQANTARCRASNCNLTASNIKSSFQLEGEPPDKSFSFSVEHCNHLHLHFLLIITALKQLCLQEFGVEQDTLFGLSSCEDLETSWTWSNC